MICDDSTLFRRGLALLLTDVGVDITGEAADVTQLQTLLPGAVPDAVILDVRMPPTFTDEGLTAAATLALPIDATHGRGDAVARRARRYLARGAC